MVEPSDPIGAVRLHLRSARGPVGGTVLDALSGDPDVLSGIGSALAGARAGHAAGPWCLLRSEDALGPLSGAIRSASENPERGPRVFARYDPRFDPVPLGDFAVFGAISRMRVAAPSDAASAVAVVEALERSGEPAYVRVPGGPTPPSSDGTFAFGRAPVLRPGSDLTVIAAGPSLLEARALGERLRSIGIDLRILDGASVKPLDVATIVRAARETGAILTIELHHSLQGLGARVASVTSMAYPVPVRRIGLPDLPPDGTHPSRGIALEYGMSRAVIEEEAWELLRARGKLR